ncbi:phage portal protein [Vibrio parahaemolyticus]|nr:phage portal protein [Vibrio parahaemolyticus]ELK3867028.1 phage portal protein [Vibrio parahaemolyticus]
MGLFDRFRRNKQKGVNPYIDAQLRGLSMSHAGVDVNYTSAMRQADVYTCVRIISESIGMIPTKLYMQKNGHLEEVSTGKREYKIFCKNPNDYMTAQELNEYLTTVLLLRGHAFLEIVENGLGGVTELLPMRYLDSVNLARDANGIPFAKWANSKGDLLTTYVPFSEGGLFDVKLQTIDGFSGVSPIKMMAEQIGTAIATQRHNAKIFENGTRLSGILSTDETLDDESIERLQASWKSAYGGTDNAGKVAVLENNLQYTNITMTNQDAQLLELLGFSRAQIAAAYRVPVHMLNDTSAQTMNNVEQNNLHFLKSTLMPIIIKLENAYERILPNGMVLKFDTRQFVRGDIKTQAEVAEVLIKNRIISHEESRQMFDLAPADPKQLFVIQSNNYTWGTHETANKLTERLLTAPLSKPSNQPKGEQEGETSEAPSENPSIQR